MNLELGCREHIDNGWIYYLKDGTSMSRERWIELVKQQVKQKGHQSEIEKIKKAVTLQNNEDSVDEVALYIYASRYCTNVTDIIKPKLTFSVVQDEMGCSQLSFLMATEEEQ